MSKELVQTKGKYETETYYEDLIYRYNPDNVLISIINVGSKQKFKEEIIKAIAKLVQQPDTDIVDKYAEEIEAYFETQGEYLIRITNYGFLEGIVINSQRLNQSTNI